MNEEKTVRAARADKQKTNKERRKPPPNPLQRQGCYIELQLFDL